MRHISNARGIPVRQTGDGVEQGAVVEELLHRGGVGEIEPAADEGLEVLVVGEPHLGTVGGDAVAVDAVALDLDEANHVARVILLRFGGRGAALAEHAEPGQVVVVLGDVNVGAGAMADGERGGLGVPLPPDVAVASEGVAQDGGIEEVQGRPKRRAVGRGGGVARDEVGGAAHPGVRVGVLAHPGAVVHRMRGERVEPRADQARAVIEREVEQAGDRGEHAADARGVHDPAGEVDGRDGGVVGEEIGERAGARDVHAVAVERDEVRVALEPLGEVLRGHVVPARHVFDVGRLGDGHAVDDLLPGKRDGDRAVVGDGARLVDRLAEGLPRFVVVRADGEHGRRGVVGPPGIVVAEAGATVVAGPDIGGIAVGGADERGRAGIARLEVLRVAEPGILVDPVRALPHADGTSAAVDVREAGAGEHRAIGDGEPGEARAAPEHMREVGGGDHAPTREVDGGKGAVPIEDA